MLAELFTDAADERGPFGLALLEGISDIKSMYAFAGGLVRDPVVALPFGRCDEDPPFDCWNMGD